MDYIMSDRDYNMTTIHETLESGDEVYITYEVDGGVMVTDVYLTSDRESNIWHSMLEEEALECEQLAITSYEKKCEDLV